MKSFYPILFFIVLSFNAFAQNWSPIVEGDVYHYELVGGTTTYDSIRLGFNNYLKPDSLVAATIWVDSVGMDTLTEINTLHLNKVVKQCDTCGTTSIYHQTSQFLGDDINVTNGCDYIFTGSNELLLKPCAPVGTTWLFESSEAISAEVIAITEGEIFGNIDSLKYIALSNGDTIVISKSHGIIEFPHLDNDMYFRLIGIQTRNLGFKIPGYREFFDFDVGDVFQYSFDFARSSESRGGTIKIRITGKQEFQDAIVYEINRITYQQRTIQGSYGTSCDTVRIQGNDVHTFDKNNISNFYPGQLFNATENTCHYWEGSDLCNWEPEDLKQTLYLGQKHNNRVKFIFSGGLIPADLHSVFSTSVNPNVLSTALPIYSYYRIWQEGLGETLYAVTFDDGEIIYRRTLHGYVIDGETTGIITPDDVLLGTNSNVHEDESWQITLSPNPASDRLIFEIQSNKRLQNLQITVYDTLGKTFIMQERDNSCTATNFIGGIDISNLPVGAYFISFQNSERMISRKFVKN